MPKPNEPYRTDEEVSEVVRRFESCELPTADFNHREHLLVALCYLLRMDDEDALAHIRARIAQADLAIKTSLGGGGERGSRLQLEMLVCELSA